MTQKNWYFVFSVFTFKDIWANCASCSLHVSVLFMLFTLFCSSVLFSFPCLNCFLFIHVFFRFRSLYFILPFVFCLLPLYYSLYLFCWFISGLYIVSCTTVSLFPAFVLFCLLSQLCFRYLYYSLNLNCSVTGLPIVLIIRPVLLPVSLLLSSCVLFYYRFPCCSHHLSCSVTGHSIVLIICPLLFPVSILFSSSFSVSGPCTKFSVYFMFLSFLSRCFSVPSILFSSSVLYCFRSPHFHGFIIFPSFAGFWYPAKKTFVFH